MNLISNILGTFVPKGNPFTVCVFCAIEPGYAGHIGAKNYDFFD